MLKKKLNPFYLFDSVTSISEVIFVRCLMCIAVLFFCTNAVAAGYFQQELKYNIKAKLDDKKHELLCSESILYTNHAPDSLPYLYLHLWPNAYADDTTPLAKQLVENGELNFYYSKPEEKGSIKGLSIQIDGFAAKPEYDGKSKEYCKLLLPKKLAPGASLKMDVEFKLKLPSATISRMGYLDESFMISQWYPKPAVYDASGWQVMPYLDQGEFYSEFGDYEVEISLPATYWCAATGVLLDTAESRLMKEQAQANNNGSIPVAKNSTPRYDSIYKTLHFEAKRVHDFAWFADKRFQLLTDTVELPLSHRKVVTQCFFTDEQESYWRHAPEYLKNALLYYSEKLGEYPYDVISIIDGTIAAGGGMEYPGISVIGHAYGLLDFEYTIMHEVGHNWFYGILASNERENPWMDEGMNSYYNLTYFENRYPDKGFVSYYFPESLFRFAHIEQYTHKTQYVLSYLLSAKLNLDQANNLKAVDFTYANYGNIVYFKTAFCMNYLRSYLGNALMDSCMKTYYERWKFKHPQPSDFRDVVTEISGKDLSWFFDGLINSNKKLDYKIYSLAKKDDKLVIGVKNKAGIAGPFTLKGIGKQAESTNYWYEGFSGKKKVELPAARYKAILLDANWDMPEIKRNNNYMRCRGIFRKVEPLRFQFLGTIDKADRTTINYFPALGFNSHDGLMTGLAFYNISLLQKPFEYLILPMYATQSNTLNGALQAVYHINSSKFFQSIDPQIKFKRYSYRSIPFALQFNKIAPSIDFILRKRKARSPLVHKFSLAHASIWEDEAPFSKEKNDYYKTKNSNYFYLNSFTYLFRNNRTLNPFELRLQAEQGKEFVKSWIEALYHFSYERRNKAAEIRVFGGKFLYAKNAPIQFGFTMNGNNDYAYDNIYLGRNDTRAVYNQQFYGKDGSFKNLTLEGNSMNWLVAANIFIPAPGKNTLAFFTDIGKSSENTQVNYDFGIALVLLRNVAEIYAPIQQSDDLNQLNYFEKIRFVLHLNALNPIEQFKNLIP